MKYNFELDLGTENSLSIISKRIKPNSIVLEFGPANGRLTRYLKEKLNCRVYIVEIDAKSAEEASVFSEHYIVDDIENYIWLNKFKSVIFDHIIFADVLEHLKSPQDVLSSAKSLLADDGTVLISVPNIAHNSVIIDLLNNKFEYRKIGLLDDTHLRFFCEQNLRKLADSVGLMPIYEDAVYKKVEETEFGNYYDQLPRVIHYYLKNRPFNRVYQFVFEFKKFTHKIDQYSTQYVKRLVKNYSNYFAQAYVNSGQGFMEEQSIIQQIELGKQQFLVDISNYENVESVRFDPINTNCILNFQRICYIMNDGTEIEGEISESNANWVIQNHYMFLSDDPQIKLKLPDSGCNRLLILYELIQIDFDSEMAIYSLISKTMEDMHNQINSLQETNEQKKQVVQMYEQDRVSYNEKIEVIEAELRDIKFKLQHEEQKVLNYMAQEDAVKAQLQDIKLKLQHEEQKVQQYMEQEEGNNRKLKEQQIEVDSLNDKT